MDKIKENDIENSYGYLALSRKFFNNAFWKEKRSFSKAEAWIDLISSVSFVESNSIIINGKLTKWGRGELPISIRFLAKRWNWSKDRVERFLKILESEGMIQRSGNAVQTIVKLVNYDKYNKLSPDQGQHRGQLKIRGNKSPSGGLVKKEMTSKDTDDHTDKDGGKDIDKDSSKDKLNKENKENNINKENYSYSNIEEEYFKSFNRKIEEKFSTVSKLNQQLNIKEFYDLRKNVTAKQLESILEELDNLNYLSRDYNSVYKTVKWKIKKDGIQRWDFIASRPFTPERIATEG